LINRRNPLCYNTSKKQKQKVEFFSNSAFFAHFWLVFSAKPTVSPKPYQIFEKLQQIIAPETSLFKLKKSSKFTLSSHFTKNVKD